MRFVSALIAALLPLSAFAKKNVCTITINSDNEKKVMQRTLPASDFEFIELLPSAKKAANDNDESNGVPKWLDEACEKKIECDVLVISGHFGGTFFGSSGYNLSLEQIERAACRPECAGIFKKPKETFLFGCNTLAGKKPDHRTPEQYLQVLIDDGIDRSDAEQAVALRYSPWGNENLQRMQGVFSNSAKIYGFDSVGPSGKKIEGMLSRYFQQKGRGYSAYLDRLTKAAPENAALKGALARTTHVEAAGMDHKSSPAICYLNDKKVPRISKIRFVERSLVSDNPLLYAPAIAAWVEEMKDNDLIEEEWEMLDRITWSQTTKERFISMADKVKNLPMIQASVWGFALTMRWVSEKVYEQKIRESILPFFNDKQITRTERDAVCGIANANERFRVKMTMRELGIRALTPDMVTALACLGNSDAELVAHAEASLKSPVKDIRENAIFTFFVMSELAKFNGFSHRAVIEAHAKETEDNLKVLLVLLAGRAEGGLDMAAWWNQKIAEVKSADFTNTASMTHLLLSLYSRPMTIEMIQTLLDRLEELKYVTDDNRKSYTMAYVHAIFKKTADPNTLADAVVARETNMEILTYMSTFNNDPDGEDEEPAKGKKFWRRVSEKAGNPVLTIIAGQNLEKLNGLHRGN